MKKHYIVLAVALLAVVGLGALAVHKYQHRAQKPSYAQVDMARFQALLALKAERGINENNKTVISNLQASNSQLTTTNTTLCNQIKAAHLVQPLCK